MRVVVTGATGLLGKFLTSSLTNAGHEVTGLYRAKIPADQTVKWFKTELLESENLIEVFSGADAVIHAAALVSFNDGDYDRLYETNVTGTRNVVNACLASGVKKLVHVSSVAALGNYPDRITVDESAPWTGGTSDYGRTKYMAELEVFRGAEEGLITSIINPSVILAPGNLDRSTGKIFKYILNGNLFYALGTGGFVDVRDVVRVIELLLGTDQPGERFVLNGFTMTWKDFMQSLAGKLGVRPPAFAIPRKAMMLIAGLEKIRSWVLRSEPLITPTSVRLSAEEHEYKTLKVNNLLHFQFTSREDTMDWLCRQLLNNSHSSGSR